VTSVALTQLLPLPMDEKVHGLEPCAEVRVRYGPLVHSIVIPGGGLLIVNEAPEEHTNEGPEKVTCAGCVPTPTAYHAFSTCHTSKLFAPHRAVAALTMLVRIVG